MLKERVITALILLPIVIWCIFFTSDSRAFAAFCGAMVVIGAWEWTRLMGWEKNWARGLYSAALALAIVAIALPQAEGLRLPLYGAAVLFWLWALRQVRDYPAQTAWARPAFMLPIGFVLLVPAWSALVSLHQLSAWWLLYLFGLVWGADTGAYFAGRAFGKNKLAPDVSPGKTIEGMVGGLLLTLCLMLAVGFYRELSGQRLLAFAGLSLLTVLASVLGDLFESMVKRRAGIKDSGAIFPGHGGALDRIDSLTAAAPVFMLGWLLAGGF